MALYLGSEKVKLYLNGMAFILHLSTQKPAIPSTVLLSADGYILQDSNGIYLIPKEGE